MTTTLRARLVSRRSRVVFRRHQARAGARSIAPSASACTMRSSRELHRRRHRYSQKPNGEVRSSSAHNPGRDDNPALAMCSTTTCPQRQFLRFAFRLKTSPRSRFQFPIRSRSISLLEEPPTVRLRALDRSKSRHSSRPLFSKCNTEFQIDLLDADHHRLAKTIAPRRPAIGVFLKLTFRAVHI